MDKSRFIEELKALDACDSAIGWVWASSATTAEGLWHMCPDASCIDSVKTPDCYHKSASYAITSTARVHARATRVAPEKSLLDRAHYIRNRVDVPL